MIPRGIALVSALSAGLVTGSAFTADNVTDPLDTYRQQGVEQVNPQRGQQLWYASHRGRACTSCHGETPAAVGAHERTGKTIEPMAASVNPQRYRNVKKLEKWFLRNCKWTFGRECSGQEKADILAWLIRQ